MTSLSPRNPKINPSPRATPLTVNLASAMDDEDDCSTPPAGTQMAFATQQQCNAPRRGRPLAGVHSRLAQLPMSPSPLSASWSVPAS